MAAFVFLYPKTGLDIGGAVAPPFSSMFASVLLHKDSRKVKIIDQRREPQWRAAISTELRSKPVFVGITAMAGPQIKYAIEMASYVRSESAVPIVWGGPHPTTLPEQTLQNANCDIVVVNEGEQTVLELAEALANNRPLEGIRGIYYKQNGMILANPPRDFIDVNALPDTPWELIDAQMYISKSLYIKKKINRLLDIGETSRGCPYRCAYCSNSQIKKSTWRPMSAEKAIGKIVNDVKQFNLDGIWIRDDNFFVDLERARQICEGFLKHNLNISWYTAGTRVSDINRMDDKLLHLIKQSGCATFKIGAESGCNRILRYINKVQTKEDILKANKKLIKFNIAPIYTFMIGFPTETRQEMLETINTIKQLFKENKLAMIDALNMFTPHKYTVLYDDALKMGMKEPVLLEDWQGWLFRGSNHAGWFTREEKLFIENACDTSIYFGNVRRVFKSINNPVLRIMLMALMYLPEKYFKLKWKHNWFGYDPFFTLMRAVRKICSIEV